MFDLNLRRDILSTRLGRVSSKVLFIPSVLSILAKSNRTFQDRGEKSKQFRSILSTADIEDVRNSS